MVICLLLLGNVLIYSPHAQGVGEPVAEISHYSMSQVLFQYNNTTAPDFADLDADGKKDIIFGSGFIDDDELNGVTAPEYCEIIGSFYNSTAFGYNELFRLTDSSSVNISYYSPIPQLIDMDNDMDYDLAIGDAYGNVHYYRNNGTISSHSFDYVGKMKYYSGQDSYDIDVGCNAAPSFADFDADGDVDMIIGESTGLLKYYKNDGFNEPSVDDIRWTNMGNLENDTNVDIDVGSYAVPEIFKYDSDEDYDIVIGSFDDGFTFFYNIGTPALFNLTEKFVSFSMIEDDSSKLLIRFEDVNAEFANSTNDNKLDMIISDLDGEIMYSLQINDRSDEEKNAFTFFGDMSYDDIGITQWDWNFGDGFSDSGEYVTHSFAQQGDYTVTLTVYDGDSNQDSTTCTAYVVDSYPEAFINGSVGGNETETLIFHANESAAKDYINQYEWDLDYDPDGSFDPDEEFNNDTWIAVVWEDDWEGYIALRITDQDFQGENKTDIDIFSIIINNKPPTCKASFSDSSLVTSKTVSEHSSGSATTINVYVNEAIDASSYDTISNYEWDWDDGSDKSTIQSPNHQYDNNGTYVISLKVQDSDDDWSEISTLSLTLQDSSPSLIFSGESDWNPSTCDEGNYTLFKVNGTSDFDSISKYEWDFDYSVDDFQADSNGGQDATTNYTFMADGSFTIATRITDADGSTDIETKSITINDEEPTAILSGPSSGMEDLELYFSALSSISHDDITKIEWNWDYPTGDWIEGSIIGIESNIFYDPDPNPYVVGLRVTDSDNDVSAIKTIDVLISGRARPELSTTSNFIDEGEDIIFDGTASDAYGEEDLDYFFDFDYDSGNPNFIEDTTSEYGIVTTSFETTGTPANRWLRFKDLTGQSRIIYGRKFIVALKVRNDDDDETASIVTMAMYVSDQEPTEPCSITLVTHPTIGNPTLLRDNGVSILPGPGVLAEYEWMYITEGSTLTFNAEETNYPDTPVTYEWDFQYENSQFTVDSSDTSPTNTFNGERYWSKMALRKTDDDGKANVFVYYLKVIYDTDGDLFLNWGPTSIESYIDLDDDNDGATDIDEIATGYNPLDDSSTPADTDGDGTLDITDSDIDGDGYPNNQDMDPYHDKLLVVEIKGFKALDYCDIDGGLAYGNYNAEPYFRIQIEDDFEYFDFDAGNDHWLNSDRPVVNNAPSFYLNNPLSFIYNIPDSKPSSGPKEVKVKINAREFDLQSLGVTDTNFDIADNSGAILDLTYKMYDTGQQSDLETPNSVYGEKYDSRSEWSGDDSGYYYNNFGYWFTSGVDDDDNNWGHNFNEPDGRITYRIYHTNEISGEKQMDLAKKYSPVFYYDDGEANFPSDVEEYFDNSALMGYDSEGPGDTIRQLIPSNLDLSYPGYKQAYLNFDGYPNYNTIYGKYTIYARVCSVGKIKASDPYTKHYVIQYWSFLYDNDHLSDHEADWEMVQIRVTPTSSETYSEQKTTLSYHYDCSSRDYDSGSVEKFEGETVSYDDHIQVYIANGGHGAHYSKGDHYMRIDFPYGVSIGGFDHCDDDGKKIMGENFYSELSSNDRSGFDQYSIKLLINDDSMSWLDFNGHWGQTIKGSAQSPKAPPRREAYRGVGLSWDHRSLWHDPLWWEDLGS